MTSRKPVKKAFRSDIPMDTIQDRQIIIKTSWDELDHQLFLGLLDDLIRKFTNNFSVEDT